MRSTTVRARIVAVVAGVAAAAAIVAPITAHADTAPGHIGNANLAHSSDVSAADIPTSVRSGYREIGMALYKPGPPSPGLRQRWRLRRKCPVACGSARDPLRRRLDHLLHRRRRALAVHRLGDPDG